MKILISKKQSSSPSSVESCNYRKLTGQSRLLQAVYEELISLLEVEIKYHCFQLDRTAVHTVYQTTCTKISLTRKTVIKY